MYRNEHVLQNRNGNTFFSIPASHSSSNVEHGLWNCWTSKMPPSPLIDDDERWDRGRNLNVPAVNLTSSISHIRRRVSE